MQNQSLKAAVGLAVVTLAAQGAAAIDIELDFGSNAFFATNATARAAVEAAADDLSAAITTTLAAIPDSVVGSATQGGNTYNFGFDLSYSYLDPDTGASADVDNAALGDNVFRVYVGSRNLNGGSAGTFQTLGRGGPGGAGFASFANGNLVSFEQAEQAVNNADAAADAAFPRASDAPVVFTFSGDATFNGGGRTENYPFSFDVGPTIGALAFDAGTNGNGGALSSGLFQFDHTAPVASNRIDLYSVALHELLHTVGIGIYDSWDANVSGDDWLGEAVQALLGVGDDNNLIDPDGMAHIAENVEGTNVLGVEQEVVMSPTIGAGERRFLTDVDLAFLTDIGWTTSFVAIPEPGTAAVLVVASLGLLRRRRASAAA